MDNSAADVIGGGSEMASSSSKNVKKIRSPSHVAMDFLARREYAFYELVEKLVKRFKLIGPQHEKGIKAEKSDCREAISYRECVEVVERLRQEGLQSDERYVEAFVRYRANQGQGPLKISQALKVHCVDEVLIAHNIQCQSRDWFALASNALIKKYGPINLSSNEMSYHERYKYRARQQRFLQSRGFSYDQINAAIDCYESKG